MDNVSIFIITVVTAVIVGYLAHKNNWKIADYF